MKKINKYKPNRGSFKKFGKKRNARELGYDSVWQKYRAIFLAKNPRCYICSAKSEIVDHFRAHKGDVELFRDLENHIPMCKPCHNYITGKFDRHNPPLTVEKFKWMNEERAKNKILIRIRKLKSYTDL